MARPTLYLFIGYPGAGKTTAAKLIEEHTGAVHIWTDQERQKRFGKATHSAAESEQLYKDLNDHTDHLLASGCSVIFDTNFNFRKDRAYLRSIADKYGANLVTIWLSTDLATAMKRAIHDDHRHRNGYHQVMSESTFNNIANRLEIPDDSEKVIKIDGKDLDKAELLRQLELHEF
jgi:predicted kinase